MFGETIFNRLKSYLWVITSCQWYKDRKKNRNILLLMQSQIQTHTIFTLCCTSAHFSSTVVQSTWIFIDFGMSSKSKYCSTNPQQLVPLGALQFRFKPMVSICDTLSILTHRYAIDSGWIQLIFFFHYYSSLLYIKFHILFYYAGWNPTFRSFHERILKEDSVRCVKRKRRACGVDDVE